MIIRPGPGPGLAFRGAGRRVGGLELGFDLGRVGDDIDGEIAVAQLAATMSLANTGVVVHDQDTDLTGELQIAAGP